MLKRNLLLFATRISFLVISSMLIFASPAVAQKPIEPASDVFQLGSRKVRIPPPEGFTEIFTRFDRIAGRLIATEDPANEALTGHLPQSELQKFETNQDQDLDFYTKVSVSRTAKTSNATPAMFAAVVSELEKNIDTLLDPNNSLLKRVEGNSGKSLSELWGSETTVKLNQPKHLGSFEKGEDIFSMMMFMNVDVSGKKYSVLITASFVRVNQRLVFVNAYKMNPASDDIEMLRTFAKKWTAAILAANKEAK